MDNGLRKRESLYFRRLRNTFIFWNEIVLLELAFEYNLASKGDANELDDYKLEKVQAKFLDKGTKFLV